MNFVGGIVGREYIGTINECTNTGTVYGKDMAIGGIAGIVGWNNCAGTLKNSYNIGKVISDKKDNSIIGGIVGYLVDGEVRNNYSIGEIEIKGSGVTMIGGALGVKAKGEETNNFYLTGKSNATFDSNYGEGKDNEYMKGTTFLNKLNEGELSPVWEYREGENKGYPVLVKAKE